MAGRLEQLQAWLVDLQHEQEEVAAALEPLLRRKDELRQKVELVQRLLSLESGSETGPECSRERVGLAANAQNRGSGGNRVGSELQDAVKEILVQHGKPMHVSEIRTALVERGMPIPGKGTDANIIVHLRRAPKVFVRKGRGTYGLVGPRSKVASGAAE